MDLSVVVVNWNVQELLAGSLSSVFESLQGEAIQHEVWVVDNASADGSAEMVRQRFPQARLIANRENRGSRFVVLLNPDTVVRGQALALLYRFLLQTPSVGMAGPRLVYADGRFQHSAFRFPSLAQVFLDFFPLHHRLLDSGLNGRYPRRLYGSGQPFAVDHPLGACLMVRREAMEQVGVLDEGFFMYCEDVDWARRLKTAGWGIYCVPSAEVVHLEGQSTRQFREGMFVALWRSRFRLFGKHHGRFYNWAVRRIVLLGLWAEEGRARRRAPADPGAQAELARRLAAYQQVRELARA